MSRNDIELDPAIFDIVESKKVAIHSVLKKSQKRDSPEVYQALFEVAKKKLWALDKRIADYKGSFLSYSSFQSQ
jgi:hypothetical protein